MYRQFVPSSDPAAAPPAFARLAAHPLRWQLMTELARSDFRVRELVTRIGQPQNLVSYHLGLLRKGGLVTTTRSTFDGRDTYYHLDLERCADALAHCGAALHPALNPASAAPRPPVGHQQGPTTEVLFVCTGNSARSPIAEALLRRHADSHVTATSAGSRPKGHLHPHTVQLLRDGYGIDVSRQRPRHLNSLSHHTFHHVITLCDKAREDCPEFPHEPRRLHWSIPDPASTDDASYPAFLRTATEIETRIRHLLPVLTATEREEAPP
jgi:ArsR family transcriptional regulator, arsenate/arsenite/antimonite-responsive transcriptional repressor / arsenate reductase (thioredoxin)